MLHSKPNYFLLDAIKLINKSAESVRFEAKQGYSVQIDAHAVGLFRVQIRYKQSSKKSSTDLYPLLAREEAVGEYSQLELVNKNRFLLEQYPFSLMLDLDSFRLTLCNDGRELVRIDHVSVSDGNSELPRSRRWQVPFSLTDTELHGLSRQVQNMSCYGQCFDNAMAWRDMLPYVWHRSGWGVYVNSTGHMQHDVGCAQADQYRLTVQDESLDIFLFVGDPADIFNQFGQLTGRVPQVPVWALGPLLSPTNINFGQAQSQLNAWREKSALVEVIGINDRLPWLVNAKTMIEWDEQACESSKADWANLKPMAASKIVSVLPLVYPDTSIFSELEDRAWLLATESGDACLFEPCLLTGGRSYALLDLTHKDVYRFWFERLCMLFDEGVSSVLLALPQDIPGGTVARNDDYGVSLTQGYVALLKQAVFEAMSLNKVPAEGIMFSSDIGITESRYAYQIPAYESGQSSLQTRLEQMFVTGDLGCTAPVLVLSEKPNNTKVWLQELLLGIMGANFVLPSIPPDLDEQALSITQEWLRFRSRLIPYVLGAFEDAARVGLPVQRSMALAFPKDETVQAYPLQYLFGPALLIAPALDEQAYVEVYLPEGDAWWDLNTGWRYEGGQALSFQCELGQIPVFGREGHVLCLGPELNQLSDFNTARVLDEVWMFGMPLHNPCVFRNKIRVMQMQGSSYIKGLEGLRILPSEGLEVKRRGAEVRISRER